MQHCKNNAAQLSENDWYAMITNLAVFDGGERVIHILSKAYPKYKHSETQDKIRHFLESGTKPMTCKTIAEKGFICPKMEDDSCNCKSPAALCYQALSVEELREFLKQCEIKDYFRFKASDIKPLLTLHRELYKKYAGSKETRRETEGAELPDWYERATRS